MKKRVAIFINSLSGGGAERVASIISKKLKCKYDIYLLLIENKIFYDYSGELFFFGKENKSYLFNVIYTIKGLNKYVKNNNIDCVISFLTVPNLINCLFNKKAARVISIRNHMGKEICVNWRELFKLYLCKKIFKNADKVISVSDELNSNMIECFGIAKERACVITNPYDIREIEKLSASAIEEDIEMFIKNNNTAIAVGRLEEQKGYKDLIEIFRGVKDIVDNAALLILGEGSQMESLQQIVKKNNLEKHIKFIGVKKNPFAYMKRCKIYVSASKYEGFPNTLVEAMACGLPPIQTDCKTGPREILGGNDIYNGVQSIYTKFGVLVPSYTRGFVNKNIMIQEFIAAWVNLLNDNETRERYAKNVRNKVLEFSIEKCIEKYSNVIEEMC